MTAGYRVCARSAIDLDEGIDLISPIVKNLVCDCLRARQSLALGETDNTIKKASVIAA